MMTPGERMIWAAAFVDSLRDWADQATQSVDLNLRVPSNIPSRAAVDAARAVRTARSALTKLVEMPVKPEWREHRDEEIAMLREMLDAPEIKLRR